ncbi:response regulator transcription factor [Undibacterium jejuense]|uniref:Response regulator transcription factor n=1 Tax=Undibacterium jejuense TaxID=1344949 RepID=A0A923KP69_9BURK|nr:LytTR family DNA-binding domain-containing protein [Undibacterium jejuense]MBC3861356.1 response regulator transcription factor [Undibacterium jejuense]
MNSPTLAHSIRALIAEDEAILRKELVAALAMLWPDLEIVAEVSDGQNAVAKLNELRPEIAFLDVRMPGLSGIDVARLATHRCHIVFITAYNDHAIAAFDHGAVDYLLKPLDLARLALTIQRLKQRLHQQPADMSSLSVPAKSEALRWIQASSGNQLRFVNVDDVQCFHADAKYTKLITTRFEALIRTPIKDLLKQLDLEKFWQISRSAIVNVSAIDTVQRIDNGLALRLQNRAEWLNVSQPYQHQFRQM